MMGNAGEREHQFTGTIGSGGGRLRWLSAGPRVGRDRRPAVDGEGLLVHPGLWAGRR